MARTGTKISHFQSKLKRDLNSLKKSLFFIFPLINMSSFFNKAATKMHFLSP